MGVLSAFSKPADRRLLVLFRAPTEALRPLVPEPWEPVDRGGRALLELAYAHQPGLDVGPLPFGGDSSLLAWRVPVERAAEPRGAAERGVWVVRRWSSSRFGGRFLVAGGAPDGSRGARRAAFRYALSGLDVALDVAAQGGGALLLRGTLCAALRSPTFSSVRDAEETVAGFGPILNPSALATTLGRRDVSPWRGLQPLELVRLEVRGPLELGDLPLEPDSAYLLVRRRMQPAALRLPRLADLGGEAAPSLQAPLLGRAPVAAGP